MRGIGMSIKSKESGIGDTYYRRYSVLLLIGGDDGLDGWGALGGAPAQALATFADKGIGLTQPS